MLNTTREYEKKVKDLLPYLLIVVAVTLSYYGVLAGKYVLLDRDLYWFFYQNSHYLARSLAAGRIPLWNPYAYGGEPFFAQAQPGVLYPLHWLYSFIPVDELFSRLLVLHVAMLGVFSALLVRELGGGRTAAALGGIAIAFSGITASLIYLQSSLFAIAWLPLAMWSLVRSLRNDSPSHAILSGMIFGIMIYVGGIEVLAMGLFLGAVVHLFPGLFPIAGPTPRASRRFALFGLTVLTMSLVSAVQLLPFYELTRYSYRTGGVDVKEALTWSLRPQEWLYLVLPDVFRRGKEFYWVDQNWLRTIYVGIVPVLLSLAFVLKLRKRALGFLCLGGLCLLLATGGNLPLYGDVIHWIPGLRSIRYPSKFLMLMGFAVALSAPLGWEQLRNRGTDTSASRRFSLVFLVLSIISALSLFLTEFLDASVQHALAGLVQRDELELLPGGIIHNIDRLLALSAVTSLAIYVASKEGRMRRLGRAALPLLLVVDLMGAMPYATVFHEKDCLDSKPERAAELEKEDREFRVFSHNSLWNKQFPDVNDLLKAGTGLFMPNVTMRYGIDHSQGYRVLTLSRIDQITTSIARTKKPDQSRLVDLMNIRYLLWPSRIVSPDYRLIESSDSLYFYENRRAMPRAFLAEDYRVCSTGVEFQTIMEDPEFDPRGLVLLDKRPSLPDGWNGKPEENGGEEDEVTITSYAPERVRLTVRCSDPKFLVLGDAYFPGWKARVNNKSTEIYRADYAFRAIAMEPGESVVEFTYEPESLAMGSWISAVTLFLLMGLGFITGPLLRPSAALLRAAGNHLPEFPRVKTRSSHQ